MKNVDVYFDGSMGIDVDAIITKQSISNFEIELHDFIKSIYDGEIF